MEEQQTWSVYVHTNIINNKKYVGITKRVPELRWCNGKGYKGQVFGAAIEKYGWDNFKHEVLYSGLTQEEAEQKEIELIALWNTCDRHYGYNRHKGGDILNEPFCNRKEIYQYDIDGNFINKYESITQACLQIKANYNSLCDTMRKGLDHVSYGYRWSYDYLGKKIEAIVPMHQLNKKVYQYSLDGTFLNEYDCITDAERATGISNSNICACCKGKHKYTYDYQWSYKKFEKLPPINKAQFKYESCTKKQEKAVYQYNLQGDYINCYKSLVEAQRKTNVSFKKISNCCRQQQKQSGGFMWFFEYQGIKCAAYQK